MQETWVQSLGQEGPLAEGMATQSSTRLENSVDRGAWQAAVHRVKQNWTQPTQLSRICGTLVLEFEDFPHYFPWMSISFKISVFGCRGGPKMAEE